MRLAGIEPTTLDLGGEETCRTMRGDGRIQNVQVKLGTSTVMVSEATDHYPAMAAAFYLYVSDVEAAMKRALESGASMEMEVGDMPYGDRQGGGRDKHGNIWWISQRIVEEPHTPQEASPEPPTLLIAR